MREAKDGGALGADRAHLLRSSVGKSQMVADQHARATGKAALQVVEPSQPLHYEVRATGRQQDDCAGGRGGGDAAGR